MKKLFVTGLILSCVFAQQAKAQSVLSNLLSGVANAAATSAATTTNNSTQSNTGKNVLGAVANSVLSTTTSSGAISESTGNLITNLIAAVAGDITTTATTIIGSWGYKKPSVQFESENALAQAGGVAIAEKLESKVNSIYKLVGIKSGKMNFTFEANGNVSYGVGGITRKGTYVFDEASKTINITTSGGAKFKCYVTVSGNEMYLTLDGSKLLALMKTLGSKFQTLSTVTTLADSYAGMKVGFCFEKK